MPGRLPISNLDSLQTQHPSVLERVAHAGLESFHASHLSAPSGSVHGRDRAMHASDVASLKHSVAILAEIEIAVGFGWAGGV